MFSTYSNTNSTCSPQLATWFNPDPMTEKYYNYTPYNYCVNNPVNFVDPDGRSFFSWLKKVFCADDSKDLGGAGGDVYTTDDEDEMAAILGASTKDNWNVNDEVGFYNNHGKYGKFYIAPAYCNASRKEKRDNAQSQGGGVGGDTWNSTSNYLNGAGFTVAGAEYSGSRALSRTVKYVSSVSKTTPTEVMFKVLGGSVYASTRFVSNATKVLKVGGAATGVLGVGMTGYEIYTGQKSLMGEGGLDLIMGGVAFIPGGGWIVSGAYFGGKYLLEATGNDFWNEP